jgi:hypothetical protein
MKKLFLIVIAVASLSSCSKSDDDFGTSLQAHAVEPIRPIRYLTLDMLDVHLVNKQSSNTYLFQEGGYRYEFTETNEQYTLLFQVDVDTLDKVKHITGRYNGKAFIMWNGGINFCGGPQGVQFNYSINK